MRKSDQALHKYCTMLHRCPNCGHEFERPIKWGIKSCTNCRCFLETNTTNRLLGAAWELRKCPTMGYDHFKFRTKLEDDEAWFVYQHIIDECYSHDDFIELVKNKQRAA